MGEARAVRRRRRALLGCVVIVHADRPELTDLLAPEAELAEPFSFTFSLRSTTSGRRLTTNTIDFRD